MGSVFSSCAICSRCCSIVEGPDFDSRIVCEAGERLMAWRSYGVNICVGMLVEVFGLQVYEEPVKRWRVWVSCWYGEIHRS